jgi:hypothetical protein
VGGNQLPPRLAVVWVLLQELLIWQLEWWKLMCKELLCSVTQKIVTPRVSWSPPYIYTCEKGSVDSNALFGSTETRRKDCYSGKIVGICVSIVWQFLKRERKDWNQQVLPLKTFPLNFGRKAPFCAKMAELPMHWVSCNMHVVFYFIFCFF